MSISSTEEIVAELRAGRMVILVDEEDRENEGDLVLAADFVTPEAINFMITHARGLVCLTLKAKIPGADQAKFEELTGKAKAGCPVSKLLKANITLDASLLP